MKRRPLAAFFDDMYKAYASSDYAAAAALYDMPGALYVGDQIIVFRDRTHLAELLQLQCARNHAMGVRSVRPTLVGQSLWRGNNYSAWVLWEHFDAMGKALNSFNARYFCRDDENGTPIVQLVEFPELPACFTEADVVRLSVPQRCSGSRRPA